MFDKMKYIVIDNGMYDAPIIFDVGTSHQEMAFSLGGPLCNVISAGFVRHTSKGLECFGESVSLNKQSRQEEDSKLVNKMLGVRND